MGAEHMVEDVVRQLGYLALGSRLKRIGERLQADVQRFFATHDVIIQSGQFPLLAALDRQGPLTISELAQAVGVTQPGVTRMVSQLAKAGLVDVKRNNRDQRFKTVALTAKAGALVDRSKRDLWPPVEQAVAAICGGRQCAFLDRLTAIEDALATRPLDQRANARLSSRRRGK